MEILFPAEAQALAGALAGIAVEVEQAAERPELMALLRPLRSGLGVVLVRAGLTLEYVQQGTLEVAKAILANLFPAAAETPLQPQVRRLAAHGT